MILVTGATGLQGGAVATALLVSRIPVRAFVRNLDEPAAVALAARGANLAKGDFGDSASLRAAMVGVTGVFSVQLPPTDPKDPGSEVRIGKALINAAKASGVHSYVHTSVARAGDNKTSSDGMKDAGGTLIGTVSLWSMMRCGRRSLLRRLS